METQAYDLGKQAFGAGIRVPIEDQKLQGLLGKCSEKMPLLAAWYRGWTVASMEEVKPWRRWRKREHAGKRL